MARPGWQVAEIDAIADKALAPKRVGDSRSLVVLEGDAAWLLDTHAVAVGPGLPQLGRIVKEFWRQAVSAPVHAAECAES